ncbi:carbonic anhydrase 2-like [Monodelphis domestica]|uniref:carbonic anhydrase 2-like n=1 Tax=Monodelphis domestica TaxID=13616 RepID=UPI00020F7821|nr:carbonic anhydrase 2-like [Monodelphis domestica]
MSQRSLTWGYNKDNGPHTWYKHFPIARGKQQSPIDIQIWNAKFDSSLKPLNFNYSASTTRRIVNKGHSFEVEFDSSTDKSVLSGGPLTEKYKLTQLHFHWGRRDEEGSEHSIDDLKYASELHMVHWNTKYSTVSESIHQPDGLAVVAIFLKVGGAHQELEKITHALGSIRKKNMSTVFTNFNPACLLPDNKDYWTYSGSLTVPPLLECVTWIVLKEPINISKEQLSKFRSLYSTMEGEHPKKHIETNCRPRQSLQGRVIRRFLS